MLTLDDLQRELIARSLRLEITGGTIDPYGGKAESWLAMLFHKRKPWRASARAETISQAITLALAQYDAAEHGMSSP